MTTQDKPAVGPLSAEAVKLLPCPFCEGDVIVTDSQECQDAETYYWHRCAGCGVESEGAHGASAARDQWNMRPQPFRLGPTAPAEAGGTERESEAWEWLGQLYPNDAPSDLAYDANEMIDAFLAGSGRSDRMAKALERIAGEQQYRSGYCQTDITVEPALSADEAQTVAREALAHNPALRPQPSGETLQSLAQAFEDAMEGSHGAWAVSGDEGPLSATTVADKIQADTDAKLTDCPSGETREAVLKGVGKINGDGWKDTTTEGEIVFVWNAEKPAPYAPGQYPRVGNEGWSASTSQYDFTPATADDVPAIIALLSARPAPVASSDQPEQGALEVVAWPVVTDQWTETYCELTGRDPDGKQVTFVDGATVTTFRDMAKREIEAMLCAAPKAAVRAIAALTPPAEPVSRPAGEGEREALARLIRERIGRDFDGECHLTEGEAYRIIALLRPAAPGGGWQPIETAPKDGESILAICATAYSPVAGGTWWNEGWTHYSRPDEKWHGGVGRWFPTHWMPLPQAPAIPASEGGRG